MPTPLPHFLADCSLTFAEKLTAIFIRWKHKVLPETPLWSKIDHVALQPDDSVDMARAHDNNSGEVPVGTWVCWSRFIPHAPVSPSCRSGELATLPKHH